MPELLMRQRGSTFYRKDHGSITPLLVASTLGLDLGVVTHIAEEVMGESSQSPGTAGISIPIDRVPRLLHRLRLAAEEVVISEAPLRVWRESDGLHIHSPATDVELTVGV